MVAAREAQDARIRRTDEDFWTPIASRFRADPKRELDPFLEKLASYLTPSDVLVDVGGGAGRNSLPMASRCREVVNVEPSPGMVKEFEESARAAGITNARAVATGWLDAGGVEGDVLLVGHVTYFVPEIRPFVEKLNAAARRSVIVDVLTVPPPNQWAPAFRLLYGEELVPVPGPEELRAVLEEMGIAHEVIDVGGSSARRPAAASREEVIRDEVFIGWVAPADRERAQELFEERFDELFVETPQGFARRGAEGVRELVVTWETSNRQRMGSE
jgi:hypothetical protein